MNKKFKKLLLILTICISLFGTSMTVFAETEYVDGYLRYTVEDGSVTITGYNGNENEVTIPSKIAGVPVNTVASGAFSNTNMVTKVNLPDTIMTIEEGAFALGQTVVYNSNTNDKIETKPSEDVTEDTQKEPTKEPSKEEPNESNKEPNKEEPSESNKEPNKEEPSESNKKPSKEEASESNKESSKEEPSEGNKKPSKEEPSESNKESEHTSKEEETNIGVEEIEVDFEDLENETSQNETSESDVSENNTSIDEAITSDTSTMKDSQDTENGTETLTTGNTDNKKKENGIIPIVVGTAIVGVGIAGVLIYKKKGQK